mmetsp:Transcript_18358/g.38349  ORF Transcript_18358/g.38349 Transcript_18358/m.38349 type:complete len:359 (+) Transcript_18358:101-1177(+)
MAFVGGLNVMTKGAMAGAPVCGTGSGRRGASAVTMIVQDPLKQLVSSPLDKFVNELTGSTYVELRPLGTSADYDQLIADSYDQLFGNVFPHLLAVDRKGLQSIESCFRDRRLTVRDFCRAVCKSDVFKGKFFDGRTLTSATENMFRAVLGRGVDSYAEVLVKECVYLEGGYDKFVDAFFDDGEYDSTFEEWQAPYYRGATTDNADTKNDYAQLFQVKATGTDKGVADKIALNRSGVAVEGKFVKGPISTVGNRSPFPGSYNNGVAGVAAAPTRLGTQSDRVYRVEVTYPKTNSVSGQPGALFNKRGREYSNRMSVYGSIRPLGYRRAGTSQIVPYEQLTEFYQRVLKNGGSVTSVKAL